MQLEHVDALDIVKTFQRKFVDPTGDGFTNVAQQTRRFIHPQFVGNGKMNMTGGGDKLSFTLMINHTENDGTYRDGDQDKVFIADKLLRQGEAPWAKKQWSLGYDREKINDNKYNEGALLDYMKLTYANAQMGYSESMEKQLFSNPADATSQAIDNEVLGIPHWFPKNTSITAGAAGAGFYGMNPAGWSSVAGIDTSASAAANYRCYNGKYPTGAVTFEGLITMLNDMVEYLNFVPSEWKPISSEGIQDRSFTAGNCMLLTNHKVRNYLADWYRANNDTMGRDLKTGVGSFCQQDFQFVPYLDSDADNPIYLINKDTFKAYGKRGEVFPDSEFREIPGFHRLYAKYYDLTYQYVCFDRKKNGVLWAANS